MIWTGERVVPTDMFNLIITLQEHIARYNSTLRRIKSNDVIIDLGCGTGYGTHLLSMVTHNLVYGIDISKEAIDYAKHYYSRDNIKYLNMDIEKLDFDVLADVIISFEVIEHINPDLFFQPRSPASVRYKTGSSLSVLCYGKNAPQIESRTRRSYHHQP